MKQHVHEHMEGKEKYVKAFEIVEPPGIEPGAFLNLVLAPKPKQRRFGAQTLGAAWHGFRS